MVSEQTQFGFKYGAASVERLCSDEKKGWVAIGVNAGKNRVQVYVTKTGKVRLYINGAEAKPAAELAVTHASALSQPAAAEWLPIETAPKTELGQAAEIIIMGYAPDEEGYSPTSREGFWSPSDDEWRLFGDPGWKNPPQPTHWMPLPAAPRATP